MYCLPIHNREYLKLLGGFEKAITAQGYSGGKENVPRRVREFLHFLENRNIENIREVRTSDIIEYYEYLTERPNMNYGGVLSTSSIRVGLRNVSLFFDHLMEAGVIESNPCSVPRLSGNYRERTPLSEGEIQLLYKMAIHKIDRAILACAYGCGMRRQELSNLDISDISFSRKEIVIRKSKFNKSRSVPMADGVLKDLKEYLGWERKNREQRNAPDHAFFLSRYGKRMERKQFNERFKSLVAQTGNKELMARKPTLHLLRHSIATHMVNRGADVNYVRKFLGHTSLDTTVGIYAKRRKQKAKLHELFRRQS